MTVEIIIKEIISFIAKNINNPLITTKVKAIIEVMNNMRGSPELQLQEAKFGSRFDRTDIGDIFKLFAFCFCVVALFVGVVYDGLQNNYKLNMGKDDFETVSQYFNISLDADNMSVGAVKEPFLSLTPSQQKQLREILKKAQDQVNARIEREHTMSSIPKQRASAERNVKSLKSELDVIDTMQRSVDSVGM